MYADTCHRVAHPVVPRSSGNRNLETPADFLVGVSWFIVQNANTNLVSGKP
jgi:hypothetical protein